MFEPYKKRTIVICPTCGDEGRIVERSTDFDIYILECVNCGRKELTEPEEMAARAAYNKRIKGKTNQIVGSLTCMKPKSKK